MSDSKRPIGNRPGADRERDQTLERVAARRLASREAEKARRKRRNPDKPE